MAAHQRPSFLKRQKEQKRVARAAEKREAKRLKKQNRAATVEEGDEVIADGEPMEGGAAAESDEVKLED